MSRSGEESSLTQFDINNKSCNITHEKTHLRYRCVFLSFRINKQVTLLQLFQQ